MTEKAHALTLPALDPASLPVRTGSAYPAPFAAAVAGREKRALGTAAGLTHYGVNLVRLPPGAASSQRHGHSDEDEFVYVLSGEVVLITDGGEQTLAAGMAAGFPAGAGDAHHLVNRSQQDALYLEIGDRSGEDKVDYPDIDLMLNRADGPLVFRHKDGTPY